MYEGLGVGPRATDATPDRFLARHLGARSSRDRDGDDGGDDVGRLALSRAFGEGEEAEDWEARDDDDDRDGVRKRASDEGVVEGEGEGQRARGRGAGERGRRGGR